MKKFFAVLLCLATTTPCFAMNRYENYYPNRRLEPPRHEFRYDTPREVHYVRNYNRTSQRTKTLATVAGVVGIATLISIIAD